MRKISNFTIFFITLCIIVGVIIFKTTIRINATHEEKLIYAMQSKVEYYAKRCYLENKCNNEITLDMLYDNNYLKEVYHPVTKELINPKTKIKYDGEKVIINWEE